MLEAFSFFSNLDTCNRFISELRWKNGPECPKCGSTNDSEYGWVSRTEDACPKCKRSATRAIFEEMHFKGCTHRLYVEVQPEYQFTEGGYTEAKKILETIFDEKRVHKPIEPRFHPMYFKC